MISTLSNVSIEHMHSSITGRAHFLVFQASGGKKIEAPPNSEAKWSTILLDESWPDENIDVTIHDKNMMIFVGDVLARCTISLKNLEASRRHTVPMSLTDSMGSPAGNMIFILTKRKVSIDNQMSSAAKSLEEKTKNIEKLQRKLSDRKQKEENDKKTSEEKAIEQENEKKRLVLQIRKKQAALRVVKKMYSKTTSRAFERWSSYVDQLKEEEKLRELDPEPPSDEAPISNALSNVQLNRISLCYVIQQSITNYIRRKISTRFSHWNRSIASDKRMDMEATLGLIKFKTMNQIFSLMLSKVYRNSYQHWVNVTREDIREMEAVEHLKEILSLSNETKRLSLSNILNKWKKMKMTYGFRAIFRVASAGREEEVDEVNRRARCEAETKCRAAATRIMTRLITGSMLKQSFKLWLQNQRMTKLLFRWAKSVQDIRLHHMNHCFTNWKISVLSSIAELNVDDKLLIYGPRATIVLMLANKDEHKIQIALYQPVQNLYDMCSTLSKTTKEYILYHEGRLLDRELKLIDFSIGDSDVISQIMTNEEEEEEEEVKLDPVVILQEEEEEKSIMGRVNPMSLLRIVVFIQSLLAKRMQRGFDKWVVGSLSVAMDELGTLLISREAELKSRFHSS